MASKFWDKYEAALLIESYQLIHTGNVNRAEELQRLSDNLRLMATNKGIEIDEVYRNLNGMQWQMAIMEAIFDGKSYSSRPHPQLFVEMVALYQSNRSEFDLILQEAHGMINPMVVEDQNAEELLKLKWIEWLGQNNISEKTINSYISCFERVSDYAIQHGVSRVSFWLIDDFKKFNAIRTKLSGTNVFRLTMKGDYLLFEKVGKLYSQYLKDNFEQIESFVALGLEQKKNEQSKNASVKASQITATEDATPTEAEPVTHQENQQGNNVSTTNNDEQAQSQPKRYVLNLSHPGNMAFTRPCYLAYRGQQLEEVNSWRSVYIAFLRALRQENSSRFDIYIGTSLINGTCPDLERGTFAKKLRSPVLISDNIYVETNLNAQDIIRRIVKVLELFKVPESELVIKYVAQHPDVLERVETNLTADKALEELIAQLLEVHFKNGIRSNSIIDITKLRKYADSQGRLLPDDNEKIAQTIMAITLEYEGKRFYISPKTIDWIVAELDQICSQGVTIIYYSIFWGLHQEYMSDHCIPNDEILKYTLKSKSNRYSWGKTCISAIGKVTEFEGIVHELDRVWGDSPTAKVEELDSQLPYIPRDKINQMLSWADKFVWVEHGTYARTDRFIISDEQRQAIVSTAQQLAAVNSYASFNDLGLDDIIAENVEWSTIAVCDAIYNLLLKEQFSRDGQILTPKGEKLSIGQILDAFCLAKEQCTFEEVENKMKECTGESARYYVFQSLYRTMVRVDKLHYIADHLVTFDIDAIDQRLDELVKGDFAPICSICSFVLFPLCGQQWNSYILESYCYRFSNQFTLLTKNFNDKNAGVIIRKNSNLALHDVLAQALASSSVPLTEADAGRFLKEQGYLAKSKYGAMDTIIAAAQKIRKGNN